MDEVRLVRNDDRELTEIFYKVDDELCKVGAIPYHSDTMIVTDDIDDRLRTSETSSLVGLLLTAAGYACSKKTYKDIKSPDPVGALFEMIFGRPFGQ